MNCPQCKEEMVVARATSFGTEYFYCRPCKKELSEMEFLEPAHGPITIKLPEVDSGQYHYTIHRGPACLQEIDLEPGMVTWHKDDLVPYEPIKLDFECDIEKVRQDIARQLTIPPEYFLLGEFNERKK